LTRVKGDLLVQTWRTPMVWCTDTLKAPWPWSIFWVDPSLGRGHFRSMTRVDPNLTRVKGDLLVQTWRTPMVWCTDTLKAPWPWSTFWVDPSLGRGHFRSLTRVDPNLTRVKGHVLVPTWCTPMGRYTDAIKAPWPWSTFWVDPRPKPHLAAWTGAHTGEKSPVDGCGITTVSSP
jgi:hypothetical protein